MAGHVPNYGKCGECLMESVDVVQLGPDGICPKCGADYSAYPVPEGLQRREGVEYGCGDPKCSDCYEPVVRS